MNRFNIYIFTYIFFLALYPIRADIRFNGITYISNTEYFGPFDEGKTLNGTIIYPQYKYKNNGRSLTCGLEAHMQWAKHIDEHFLYPLCKVCLKNAGTRITIGTYKFTYNLPTYLYNSDYTFLLHSPTGFNIRNKLPHNVSNISLNWMQHINKSKDIPEHICLLINDTLSLEFKEFIRLKLPINFILFHVGGQGISVKSYNLFLISYGFKTTVNNMYSFTINTCANIYGKQPNKRYLNGYGCYLKMKLKVNKIGIGVSYWHGNKFSSDILGNPLFNSFNDKCVQQYRDLVFVKICYKYRLNEWFRLDIGFEPYYDCRNGLFEHKEYLTCRFGITE